MYEIERYVGGTILPPPFCSRALIDRPVRRCREASSMSIYGEGLYRNENGDVVEDAGRACDGGGIL